MRRQLRLLPALALAALVSLLIACSSGSGAEEAPTPTRPPTATSAAPSATTTVQAATATPVPANTPASTATTAPTDAPAPTASPTPTTPPAPTASPLPTSTPALPGASRTVVGRDIAFSTTSFGVDAGQPLTVTFDNREQAIFHNFHLLAGSEGDFATLISAGPDSQAVTFTINQPGSYRFQCDVHPDEMFGTLTVQ